MNLLIGDQDGFYDSFWLWFFWMAQKVSFLVIFADFKLSAEPSDACFYLTILGD